jgi:large subunit ribosomal protein L35
MADMSNVAHRHIVEQKWRKEGALDLLMERIYQMKVVPDALPEIKPTIDLQVVARSTPTDFLKSKKVFQGVEPGVFLRPKQTLQHPKLHTRVFHQDNRLYTMLLVDLDVPNTATRSYTTFLHWLKPNISLSALSSSRIPDPNTHTRYIPPHPQRGTPYHRYVCLLLPHPPIGGSEYTLTGAFRTARDHHTSVELHIPIVSDQDRLGFNIRRFASQWNLDGTKGGGIHMWREVWDDDVSHIYRDILGKEEPTFGHAPKLDPYAEVKQRKKYIS